MSDVARLESVHLVYENAGISHTALDGVNMVIESGGISAVFGPSGGGKTSLVNVVTGMIPPTEGEVYVGQWALHELNDVERTRVRRDHIGCIFSGDNLVRMYTVGDNITLPAQLAGRTVDRERYRTLVEVLDLTDVLDEYPEKIPPEIAQRAAIARAVVTDPLLIVADEFTVNLNSRATVALLSVFRSVVREFDLTALMLTPDPLAAAYAEQVWLLSDGKIAGTVDNPTCRSLMSALVVMRNTNAQLI